MATPSDDDQEFRGIQRLTEAPTVHLEVMGKARAEVPGGDPEAAKADINATYTVMERPSVRVKEDPAEKSAFQRRFVVMSPKRPKKAPPKGIGSLYP